MSLTSLHLCLLFSFGENDEGFFRKNYTDSSLYKKKAFEISKGQSSVAPWAIRDPPLKASGDEWLITSQEFQNII